MKKLFSLIVTTVTLLAQGTPPVPATNYVAINPGSRLEWDLPFPSEPVAGYWVVSTLSSNRFYTTNRFLPLATLNTNIGSGQAQFVIYTVNPLGVENQGVLFVTNLSKLPPNVWNFRITTNLWTTNR